MKFAFDCTRRRKLFASNILLFGEGADSCAHNKRPGVGKFTMSSEQDATGS